MVKDSHKAYFLWYVGTLFLLISGCKKEPVDETDPVISSFTVNGASDSAGIVAGNAFTIEFTASDDIGLNQYKISISNAFQGYTYRNYTYGKTLIDNLDGISDQESISISVPDSAASGNYEISVSVTDLSGHESEKWYGKLTLLQTSQPLINCTSHLATQTYLETGGDTLQLAGTISDDVDLKEIKILLKNKSNSNTIYSHTFPLTGTTDMIWDFSEISTQNIPIILPTSSGDYEVIVDATDESENHSQLLLQFRIL